MTTDELVNDFRNYIRERGINGRGELSTVDRARYDALRRRRLMDRVFSDVKQESIEEKGSRSSQLRQWPVQLHLVPPNAPYFQGKDVILVADCVGYSIGDFHKDYLKERSIAIACPKLDTNTEIYVDKLTQMIDNAKINTLTVMTMEVPCCNGLLGLAKKATQKASRKIPIKSIVVGIKGEILNEEWV